MAQYPFSISDSIYVEPIEGWLFACPHITLHTSRRVANNIRKALNLQIAFNVS